MHCNTIEVGEEPYYAIPYERRSSHVEPYELYAYTLYMLQYDAKEEVSRDERRSEVGSRKTDRFLSSLLSSTSVGESWSDVEDHIKNSIITIAIIKSCNIYKDNDIIPDMLILTRKTNVRAIIATERSDQSLDWVVTYVFCLSHFTCHFR